MRNNITERPVVYFGEKARVQAPRKQTIIIIIVHGNIQSTAEDSGPDAFIEPRIRIRLFHKMHLIFSKWRKQDVF